MLAVGADGLSLQDGLGVVVVVLELEQIHQLLVRGEILHFLEDLPAALSQGLLHLGGAHLRHIGITAVRQELGGVLNRGGIQHAAGLLQVQELGLPGAEHGRNAQIRFFFV